MKGRKYIFEVVCAGKGSERGDSGGFESGTARCLEQRLVGGGPGREGGRMAHGNTINSQHFQETKEKK